MIHKSSDESSQKEKWDICVKPEQYQIEDKMIKQCKLKINITDNEVILTVSNNTEIWQHCGFVLLTEVHL